MPFDLVLACIAGFAAAACAMAITLAAIKHRGGWGWFLAAYLGPLAAAGYLADRLARAVGGSDPRIVGRWIKVPSSIEIFFSSPRIVPGHSLLASVVILLAVYAVAGGLVGAFARRAPRASRAPAEAGPS